MIYTINKRIECLVLMESYGFTFTELNVMKPDELDNWIDAHNALMEYKQELYSESGQCQLELEEEEECDCEDGCIDCTDCKCLK